MNGRGIYLDHAHNNTVMNNNASNNGCCEGICLCGSCYNTVVNNTAIGNEDGFMIYFGSRNNTFIDNIAHSNRNNGIIEWSQTGAPSTWCRDNTFINNTANDNLDGIWLYCASNNTLISNIAENNDHGIAIDTSSNNNAVTGNTVTNNDKGIYVYSSSDNTITDNTCSHNTEYGIYILGNHNKICCNDIKYNGDYGIKIYSSFGNCLFGNDFVENNLDHLEHTSQAWDNGYDAANASRLYNFTPTEFEHVSVLEMEHQMKKLPSTVHNLDTGESFSTLQEAIDAVNTTDGHTIAVDAGIYNENVDVYKSVTLKSSSGNPANTVIQAANPNDHVFNVTADNITIRGFTVNGSTGHEKAGIYLYGANHSVVSNNSISNCYYGVRVSSLWYCDITDNIISKCYYGISGK